MSHFGIARLVAIGALLLGVLDMPYGYYRVMRLVVCVVATYGAFRAHERDAKGLVWTFGIVAVVFNPIVPLGFQRDDWAVVDVLGALALLTTFLSPKLRKTV